MASRPLPEVAAAIRRVLHGATPPACESPTLDFKSGRDSDNNIAEAAICFANAAGGSIVVGVEDKVAGAAAFTGTEHDAERLRKRIHELSVPPLLVNIVALDAPARLLVIDVPVGLDVHQTTSGRAPRRVSTDCLPMTAGQTAALNDERRGYDWSAEVTGLRLPDIVPEALAAARDGLARFTDYRRDLGLLATPDLLHALGVLQSDGHLNRAGALLFCRSDEVQRDHFVYLYRRTPGGEPIFVERTRTPLVLAFRQLMDRVAARRTLTPLTLPDGQQIVLEDYPEAAVREALSNALCHRDYRLSEPVTVEHSPDSWIVTSPGLLVNGVTPQNIITTPARPRNRALAKAARDLGLAEDTGRGFDRMVREMVRAGRPLPRIHEENGSVRLALLAGSANTSLARFAAQLSPEERDDTDTMLLLLHMCEHRSVDAEQAGLLFQKPAEQAEVVLRRLAGSPPGLIEPTKRTARRRAQSFALQGRVMQQLGSAVRYNRPATDEIDRKVIAHIREYGWINNRTLQNFMDVGVFRARDYLAKMTARGIIARISEQKRGPSVQWGPGPRFPASRRRPSRTVQRPQEDLFETPEN